MKSNHLKNLTLSAMFLAIGLVLPFFTGQIQQIGNMLLPMHLPVFLCALVCGWRYGLPMAFILPILRSVLFGMPPMYPIAIAMAFELAVYAFVSGFLYEKSRWQCIRALYRCTSSLEWYEWGSGYSNWEEFRAAPNWVDYILGRTQVAQPGALFNYSTGNTHLLSAALEAATGMDELEFGKQNLFDKLGIESIQWGTDPQGIVDGGNGVEMTARDAARFGQLFLNGGVWNGEQLIPADWVTQSTSVQNAGPGGSTGQYGYQWWVRSFGGYDTYYAFGAWGQFIFVVPELDLVTVITSPGPQSSYASRPYFTDYVLAACNG